MKIPFIYICCLAILTSCGSSKIFEEPQVVLQPTVMDSLINGKYIRVKIDSARTLKLKLDTGSTLTVLNDIEMIGGKSVLTPENHKKKSQVQTATSSISTFMYQSNSLNSKISHSSNQKITVLKTKKAYFPCFAELFSYDGVYGLDAFAEAENPKPVLLDYKNNIIKILSGFDEIPHDYHEVNATFKKNIIYLNGSINDENLNFLFDTGYNGFIMLSENIFEDDSLIKPRETGKSTFRSGSGSFLPKKGLTFQNVKVNIKGLPIKETIIDVVQKTNEEAYVGLGFIKNYNWILDFKNKKIYAKKVEEFDSDKYFEILKNVPFFAMVVNKQLVILYSNTNNYNIGDVILSIDGEKVTAENMCRLQKKLIKNLKNGEDLNVVLKNP